MRRIPALIALIALFLVAAPTASAAVSGTFTSGTKHVTIVITNTGASSIERLQIKLQGAEHTGAVADRPGAVDGSYSPTDFTYEPSTPLGPGLKVTLVVSTTGPVTGVIVRDDTLTSNGYGPDTTLRNGYDPPPDEKPPGGKPPKDDPPKGEPPAECRCADFTLATDKIGTKVMDDVLFLTFDLDWDLDCNESPGTGCEGTFDVIGPRQSKATRGLDLELKKPKAKVRCKSDGNGCKDTTGSRSVRLRIANAKKEEEPLATLVDRLGRNPADGKPQAFVFHVQRTCGTTKLKALVVRVVFNSKGRVNRKKSDLDGNGKPDGA
ncbi:MAG TPA: hypothetical protein VD790_01300 [Thermoleophilaceae bacterium]|nr:hypothetical protein [Thermoleophilaceae bacterium]